MAAPNPAAGRLPEVAARLANPEGGVNYSRIARELGVSVPTVRYHAGKLGRAGRWPYRPSWEREGGERTDWGEIERAKDARRLLS